MEFIQQFINGLNLGSIYALMALGYTMVYGIAKMLNFAHGDIIMVGAYTISVGATMFGLSPNCICSFKYGCLYYFRCSNRKDCV